jgi:DNA-binding NarL/FixJ family response regulator
MTNANTEFLSALIVDDQTLVSSLLASELKRQGISATTAETVDQAFAKIRNSKPDVILLDVELEEPLSIAQVRDLVRRSSPGKIALFTSKASDSFIRNCLDVGVTFPREKRSDRDP